MAEKEVYYYNTASMIAPQTARWWLQDDCGSTMVAVARAVEADNMSRERQALAFARLYANQNLESLYAAGVMRGWVPGDSTTPAGAVQPRVSWNVVQSVVDTVAAKISKNKPRVLFQTSGGNWKEQQRAKGMSKLVDGLFEINSVYQLTRRIFVDACVFGDGWVHVYADESAGEIRAERVLPFEVIVCDTEAVNGEHRTMFRRKYVHRELALDLWGDDARVRRFIEAANPADMKLAGKAADMIAVYEGWHLGSNGRHVLAVEGGAIVDEPWKRNRFPLVPFRWRDRLVGIRGQGLAEDLIGLQLEINKLLKTIQVAQHLMAVPRYLVEIGSKVIKAHLNNEVGSIVEYQGTQPRIDVGAAVAPELYRHLETLYQRAYEVAGVSQLSANSAKPAGLNAGVALREFHDIESERFVLVGQRFEEFHLEIAELMVDLAREMYRGGKGRDLAIKAPGTKFLETIKWSEVNLPEDVYTMRAFPVSILPTTPAGRLQRVQELYQSGLLTDQTPAGVWARSMLDFPDLESAMSLQNASMDDAQRTVSRIVDDGKYEAPEAYQDLKLLSELAQHAYLKGRAQGLEPRKQEYLRRLIDDCMAIEQETQAAMAPPPQAPGQSQPGAPPDMAALPPVAPQMPPAEVLPSPAVPSELPA